LLVIGNTQVYFDLKLDAYAETYLEIRLKVVRQRFHDRFR